VLTLARPSPTASILSFYAAPTTGIYGVRFTAATSGGQTNNADIADPRILDANRVSAWDVTVRANVSSLTDLNARVFTYAWTVYLQANGRILNNALRYVSTDGFRYRQTFRGLDPNRATFYANAQGFIDAGAPLYRDVRGNDQTVAAGPSFSAGVTAQAPQYPIFFSDVAQGGPNAVEVNKVLTALAIPTAPLQPQLSNPQFVGNLSGNQSTVSAGGVFTFDTLNTLTYEIVISLDGVDFDPANVNNRVLTGTALSGSHSVLWDGLNNNAVPFPAGSYDFRIYGRNGEIHFPMLDVEGNANGGPTLEKLNGFQPADAFTVYYDDRGYRTANATVIGVLNGHLCGATSPIAQPTPTHSLVGVDSSVGGPSTYYRRWSGSSDTNVDCDNDANEYFATAKGLDLWALERSPVQVLPLVIVPLSSGIDVGTQAGATSSVLPGGTAFGSFSFTNAGDTTATGVNYSVTIGNPLDPATCPASVNFTLLPAGVTATYNPAPLCTVTFTGMPTSLTPGQTLNFNFNYVVAPTNPGPIPVNTSISAGNENCTINCAPNSASAQTMVATPVITIAKTANPVSGSNVNVGSLIEYTVAVTIGNAPLTAVLSLDDTLSAGLAFGSVISAHPSFDCSSAPDCTLPIRHCDRHLYRSLQRHRHRICQPGIQQRRRFRRRRPRRPGVHAGGGRVRYPAQRQPAEPGDQQDRVGGERGGGRQLQLHADGDQHGQCGDDGGGGGDGHDPGGPDDRDAACGLRVEPAGEPDGGVHDRVGSGGERRSGELRDPGDGDGDGGAERDEHGERDRWW
jgi:uncharacterized repeat protein (TIGR01451 family)